MTHEPECPVGKPAHATARWLCVCAALRDAYRRGYNDHARAVQHWQATHGAYRAAVPSNQNDCYPEHCRGDHP